MWANARGDLGLFKEASEAFERALEIYEQHGASLANPLVDLGNSGCLGDHAREAGLVPESPAHVRNFTWKEVGTRRVCVDWYR